MKPENALNLLDGGKVILTQTEGRTGKLFIHLRGTTYELEFDLQKATIKVPQLAHEIIYSGNGVD